MGLQVREAEPLGSCLILGLPLLFSHRKMRLAVFTCTWNAPRRQHVIHAQTLRYCFFFPLDKYLEISAVSLALCLMLWGHKSKRQSALYFQVYNLVDTLKKQLEVVDNKTS